MDYFEQDNGPSGSINFWKSSDVYDNIILLRRRQIVTMRTNACRKSCANLVQRLRMVYSALYNDNRVLCL